MKDIINVQVEEVQEWNHTYFLAHIASIPWFMVEAKSRDEMRKLVPVVLHDFLAAQKIRKRNQETIDETNFEFTLQSSFC
jgi:hypothetical protein